MQIVLRSSELARHYRVAAAQERRPPSRAEETSAIYMPRVRSYLRRGLDAQHRSAAVCSEHCERLRALQT